MKIFETMQTYPISVSFLCSTLSSEKDERKEVKEIKLDIVLMRVEQYKTRISTSSDREYFIEHGSIVKYDD